MSHAQIATPTVNYSTIPQVNKAASSKPSITRKASGGGNKKGTSAERRATHNAVERARRESLNVRFLELAANLPTTCTVRRPSKNLIVNKSLEFVRNALHNDAILRLKLEESLRQNQSMLQELNQMRAERGLSPRDSQTTSIDANQQAGFSIDALTTAFGMPNMPQPLASVEFTKQVTEQGIQFDANAQWFGGEGDEDFVSNTASGDGFSAAASDHSSPSLVGEDANAAAVAAAAAAFPNNAMFTNFNDIIAASQSSPFSSLQPATNNCRPSTSDSLDSNGMPNTYAQYAVGSGAATTNNYPSIDFMPPINPNTAAIFSNLMNSFNNQNHGGSHTPQSTQYSTYASPMSNGGGVNANGSGSSHSYSHHNNNSYFAMTA